MRLVAKVRVEHTDLGGSFVRPQSGKDVEVGLEHCQQRGVVLSIGLKPRPLLLPVALPVALYGARVHEGHLGLKFLRVKQNPWDTVSKCIQLSITCEDCAALKKLRDHINSVLLKCATAASASKNGVAAAAGCKQQKAGAGGLVGGPGLPRRPLAPRSLNTLAAVQAPSSSMASLRSGPGPAPTASGFSFGAGGGRHALASSAESAGGGVEDLESLSEEQQRALQLSLKVASPFCAGCAGTGKSLLLRHILQGLPRDTTFVTGTTGLAACHLGGTTINSFAGIGRGEGTLESLVRMASRGESLQRWRATTHLIVDEVSMMDGRLFDTLEAVARKLILSGDFHQLPPVCKGREGATQRRFCFEGEAWGRCIHDSCFLSKVFRQADLEFVELLGKIRAGACPQDMLSKLLRTCQRPLPAEDGILPTQLFTHREDVDTINLKQLRALPSEARKFVAQDVGSGDVLAAACPARRSLDLKVGAQVMLIRNVSHRQGLVNGARGVVERFSEGQGLPVVRFASGRVVTVGRERWTIASGGRMAGQRVQLPLDLAWAMSVHKSQGMTLDRVEVSLERAFEPGMAYVALSRVKALEGLRILGSIAPQALRADHKVVRFYKALRERQLRALGLDPAQQYGKAKAHVFLDVEMEEVVRPVTPGELRCGWGTKVVATIGPSCQDVPTLARLLQAGLTCARVDLSWGTTDNHVRSLQNLDEAMKQTRLLCSVWLDTTGREVMVRRPIQYDSQGWPRQAAGDIRLHKDQVFKITTDPTAVASPTLYPVIHPGFTRLVEVGQSLQIGAHLATGTEGSSLFAEVGPCLVPSRCLLVVDVAESEVTCVASNDAVLDGVLSVVLCHGEDEDFQSDFGLPLVTEHDVECMKRMGRDFEIDYVSVSFCNSVDDLYSMRHLLDSLSMQQTKIIAKVERKAAVRNFEAIAHAADGIIMSRGNLGLDFEAEVMALLQKRIISRCNQLGKPVLITRIVDTMATDVANAVLDGVDGLLLGAETLRGKFPVETVQTVLKLAGAAEAHFDYHTHHENLMAEAYEEEVAFRRADIFPNTTSQRHRANGAGLSPHTSASSEHVAGSGAPAVLSGPTAVQGIGTGPAGGIELAAAGGKAPPQHNAQHSSGSASTPGTPFVGQQSCATPYISAFGSLPPRFDERSPQLNRVLLTHAPYMSKLESLASSATRTAEKINAGLIVVSVQSGRTVSLVAKYRPPMPIMAVVVPKLKSDALGWSLDGKYLARQTLVLRGVVPMLAAPMSDSAGSEDLLSEAIHAAFLQRLVKPMDFVVCIMSHRGSMAVKVVQVNTSGAGLRNMGGGDTSPLGGTGLADGAPDHSPFGAYFVPPSQRLDLGFSPSRTLSGRPTMMMPASPRRFHLDTVTRGGGGAFLHATASEAQSFDDQPYVGVGVNAERRSMNFEDVMAAQIIGFPFDTAVCDVERKSLVVDGHDESLWGVKDEPYTASCGALVKTEPKLEPKLPPPPPSSPAPASPSTPQAGVTTRSRTQSAASTLVTTTSVPNTKPRKDKTKAKARPTVRVTKKKGAVSSVKKKRASGNRKPTNKPRGRVPGGQHIEPHDLFQYAMYKSLVSRSLQDKHGVTTNAIWRKLQALLKSLRPKDAEIVCLNQNGKLTFNTKRLKAEGVCSWEQFCLTYM
ncbi:ATP-dependent DNA helicase PIF1 [Chlorella vulgaris]